MPLRETLLDLGMRQAELDVVIKDSRAFVRSVSHWTHLLARGLGHTALHPKAPPKVKEVALKAGRALLSVADGADHMLGKRR